VQYHENILNTFLNREFNLYFDDDDGIQGNKHAKFNVFSLYGNLQQAERIKTLKEFCNTDRAILVCTDVAARGLDMPNIDWIIQYNTPGTYHDYVHRVGRTARVGQNGKALLFLEPHEIEYINELNKNGMSLSEIKLDKAMDCLVNEANNYPRQINSDRVGFSLESHRISRFFF
jgi:ATP-dependent RNA helicase DDX31/DBP7